MRIHYQTLSKIINYHTLYTMIEILYSIIHYIIVSSYQTYGRYIQRCTNFQHPFHHFHTKYNGIFFIEYMLW